MCANFNICYKTNNIYIYMLPNYKITCKLPLQLNHIIQFIHKWLISIKKNQI